MTIHKGINYQDAEVSLREADIELIKKTNNVNTTQLDWDKWRDRAVDDPTVYYFAIYSNDRLVGEIFLHDINTETKESLVGYHLFNPSMRGKGIGTKALLLLRRFATEKLNLQKLIIITGEENIASRKMAEKCGFVYTGPSWEDPKRVVYEWRVVKVI